MQQLTYEKTRKLTAKQRRWIKEYGKTLNATEAAMVAYDCKTREAASLIGHENIRKLNFDELMDLVGVTDEKLAQVGAEGLTATKPITTPDGKLQAIPDHAVRHKYWETSLKLKRKLSDKLELTGKDGEPIRLEVLAGVSFIPPRQDGDIKDTKQSGSDAQVAAGGFVPRAPEIQDANLAQTCEEDHNIDQRDIQTSTS